MTVDAVEGYVRADGDAFWPVLGLGYGGGSVEGWAESRRDTNFWAGFDSALDSRADTRSIWWELCTSGSRRDNLENALQVLAELEARLPGASIYVSAQPAYADGHVCRLAGSDGPEQMEQLAADLTASNRALAGPALTPLSPSQLVDGCHAGPDGKLQMGQELLEFFGP